MPKGRRCDIAAVFGISPTFEKRKWPRKATSFNPNIMNIMGEKNPFYETVRPLNAHQSLSRLLVATNLNW